MLFVLMISYMDLAEMMSTDHKVGITAGSNCGPGKAYRNCNPKPKPTPCSKKKRGCSPPSP